MAVALFYVFCPYRPVRAFQNAAEYLYWKTQYNDLAEGKANRGDLHATFYF
ncbi:MAG: hypothetical protein ACO36I_14170 [Candidatus Latescibacterota bacterium]